MKQYKTYKGYNFIIHRSNVDTVREFGYGTLFRFVLSSKKEKWYLNENWKEYWNDNL